MRAECGCLVEGGRVLHGYDGPCAIDQRRGLEPTEEDYCGSGGHGYYGDLAGAGRCYCGARSYPLGGPTEEATDAGDRTLTVGTVLVARPCRITIEGRPLGFLADGWCSTCQESHVIDAGLYLRGGGPWTPERAT